MKFDDLSSTVLYDPCFQCQKVSRWDPDGLPDLDPYFRITDPPASGSERNIYRIRNTTKNCAGTDSS